MEDAEESAAGPEAMAAAEAAREAGRRARNQGRRNFGARSMEALVEDMIEQAYAGDGLEVCHTLASLLLLLMASNMRPAVAKTHLCRDCDISRVSAADPTSTGFA